MSGIERVRLGGVRPVYVRGSMCHMWLLFRVALVLVMVKCLLRTNITGEILNVTRILSKRSI